MINSKKRIVALALSTGMLLSTASAFAAGDITWKVKDFITTTGFSGTVGGGLGTGQGGPALIPAYEIVYEQYLDGVATGLIISGQTAREYGLKPYASSITRPNSWYDLRYPNLQYEEIFADGEYTGLTWPTGAQLPYTSYKDFPYMWEVGGTHKEVARTKAFLNGVWFGNDAYGYPSVYTGVNADVKEENIYYGFDVFEVFEDGKARDVEVVLDTEGEGVNATNIIKAAHMTNAASSNTLHNSIIGLVNSGNGYNSVLYSVLANNLNALAAYRSDNDPVTPNTVPVFDFTGYPSDFFDNLLPIQHYFQLSGPTYNDNGEVTSKYGLVIDAYEDCVDAVAEGSVVAGDREGWWHYHVDPVRYSYYTNNLVTTHATATATTDWVYAGYELEAPYRMYEYLSIEGILFDGDIDNDGSLDTPVIFRYPTSGIPTKFSTNTSYALADPKVEWRYAFVDANYPHEIIMQKFVEAPNPVTGLMEMVATDEYKGAEKYAKENMAAVIRATENPAQPVATDICKDYQMRLEWRDNETRMLYVTPYFDINEHAGEYIAITGTADPTYLQNPYNFVIPGAPVVIDPSTIKVLNDANEAIGE
jgi:hypothetical protein